MKLACRSVAFGAKGKFSAALQSEGWARQDSNLGPRDYESPALTAELQARVIPEVKHSKQLVTNPESIRGCSADSFEPSRSSSITFDANRRARPRTDFTAEPTLKRFAGGMSRAC
jgi:hypothetical protein